MISRISYIRKIGRERWRERERGRERKLEGEISEKDRVRERREGVLLIP